MSKIFHYRDGGEALVGRGIQKNLTHLICLRFWVAEFSGTHKLNPKKKTRYRAGLWIKIITGYHNLGENTGTRSEYIMTGGNPTWFILDRHFRASDISKPSHRSLFLRLLFTDTRILTLLLMDENLHTVI